MTRRRLVGLGIGVLMLTGVAIGVVLLARPPHPVRFATYERIRLGMTMTEVEQTVGLPEGDYATGRLNGGRPAAAEGRTDLVFVRSRGLDLTSPGSIQTWSSDNGVMFVQYDSDGRVVGKVFGPWGGGHVSLFDRVRAWLGW